MTDLVLRFVAPCPINYLGSLFHHLLRCFNFIFTFLLFSQLPNRELLIRWVQRGVSAVTDYQKYFLCHILGSLAVQQYVTDVLFLCGNFRFFVSFRQACWWQVDDILYVAKFFEIVWLFCNFQLLKLCIPKFYFVNFKIWLGIWIGREEFQTMLEFLFEASCWHRDEEVLVDEMIAIG